MLTWIDVFECIKLRVVEGLGGGIMKGRKGKKFSSCLSFQHLARVQVNSLQQEKN